MKTIIVIKYEYLKLQIARLLPFDKNTDFVSFFFQFGISVKL
jgi:hypothetical protein